MRTSEGKEHVCCKLKPPPSQFENLEWPGDLRCIGHSITVCISPVRFSVS